MSRAAAAAAAAFDVLGDPVRRRILELLSAGERASGDIVDAVQRDFDISQPAVSQHLKVLRDGGFTAVRADGQRRVYSLDPAPLREIDAWLDPFRRFWAHKLDALATEIARGKKERRRRAR
ncbi:MAG TPA: metalloregulator ArsR/SmtB family transcription factor [Kofleriaceae bacterium]|nr:metalloregulator ArsR/SmtB family transcription factor [Kofleriaceae bacterium]